MNFRSCLLIVFIGACITLHAQESRVAFHVSHACDVLLFEPLDGGLNKDVLTKTLKVSPGKPTLYTVDMASSVTIFCRVPKLEQLFYLMLTPGDSVSVFINKEKVTYSGRNAAGLQFYNDTYTRALAGELKKMDGVISSYIEGKVETDRLVHVLRDSLQVDACLNRINGLEVSDEYRNLLTRETALFYDGDFADRMSFLTSKKSRTKFAKNYQLNDNEANWADSIKVKEKIDSLCSVHGVKPTDYCHRFEYDYILVYFKRFHSTENNEQLGSYARYLAAPKEMQPYLLGKAALATLKFDPGDARLPKLKAYLNRYFPESDYAKILNERIPDEVAETVLSDDIVFVEQEVNSLAQLCDVEGLKGQYIFVDLWATWCNPCRVEFGYNEQLHKVLDKYRKVAVAYLSIDSENQEKIWRKLVASYHLSGHHLRASDSLLKEIKEKIYGSPTIQIPRYLLIAPDGRLLHTDLPRPSRYIQLEEELDKYIIAQ